MFKSFSEVLKLLLTAVFIKQTEEILHLFGTIFSGGLIHQSNPMNVDWSQNKWWWMMDFLTHGWTDSKPRISLFNSGSSQFSLLTCWLKLTDRLHLVRVRHFPAANTQINPNHSCQRIPSAAPWRVSEASLQSTLQQIHFLDYINVKTCSTGEDVWSRSEYIWTPWHILYKVNHTVEYCNFIILILENYWELLDLWLFVIIKEIMFLTTSQQQIKFGRQAAARSKNNKHNLNGQKVTIESCCLQPCSEQKSK